MLTRLKILVLATTMVSTGNSWIYPWGEILRKKSNLWCAPYCVWPIDEKIRHKFYIDAFCVLRYQLIRISYLLLTFLWVGNKLSILNDDLIRHTRPAFGTISQFHSSFSLTEVYLVKAARQTTAMEILASFPTGLRYVHIFYRRGATYSIEGVDT